MCDPAAALVDGMGLWLLVSSAQVVVEDSAIPRPDYYKRSVWLKPNRRQLRFSVDGFNEPVPEVSSCALAQSRVLTVFPCPNQ